MTKTFIAQVAAVSLLFTPLLLAQNTSSQPMYCAHCPHCADQSAGNTQAQNQNFQAGRPQTSLSGDILSINRINIRSASGASQTHALAQIQTRHGQRKAVDLGPIRNVDRLGLQPGDFLQVRGQERKLSGRPVLMAQQIRHEGQIVHLSQGQNPSARSSSQQTGSSSQLRQNAQNQRSQSSQDYSLSGRVEGFRHINLRNATGQRDQHSLVKVTLQNGRSAVIDLGPKRNLNRLELEKGARIQVKGQRGRVNGRQVLMANQVRVGDDTIRINRSPRLEQAGRFRIQGTVEGYQLTTIGSGTNQMALLKLRLADGRSVLIDAGKQYTVGEFNLKDLNIMDRVTIEGERKNVQGRQVLVANNIQFQDTAGSSEGREYTRERQPSSSEQQQSQPSRQSSQNTSRSGQSR